MQPSIHGARSMEMAPRQQRTRVVQAAILEARSTARRGCMSSSWAAQAALLWAWSLSNAHCADSHAPGVCRLPCSQDRSRDPMRTVLEARSTTSSARGGGSSSKSCMHRAASASASAASAAAHLQTQQRDLHT